ncbi:hypothetical protein [Pseudorhodoplanes sp.]|nr:hypothetical protein [Pseudorhodoplanes sp.]HWV40819.1 hypothetical protein [Pseudorhodoplanes sp.]
MTNIIGLEIDTASDSGQYRTAIVALEVTANESAICRTPISPPALPMD